MVAVPQLLVKYVVSGYTMSILWFHVTLIDALKFNAFAAEYTVTSMYTTAPLSPFVPAGVAVLRETCI